MEGKKEHQSYYFYPNFGMSECKRRVLGGENDREENMVVIRENVGNVGKQ